MDVAHFSVCFLHEYLTKRHELERKWVTRACGFKSVVEAKVGHKITETHTTPNTVGAQQFECELRNFIVADPEFGVHLWLVLTQRMDYATYLTDKEVLYDPGLFQSNAPYVPRERDWCAILAAAIGVLLVVMAVVSSVRFLT